MAYTSLRTSGVALFDMDRLKDHQALRRASVRRRPFPPAGSHHQHVVAKQQ
jgi:hypothetical protein